jgi:osmotically-inducible protein OsmY
VAEKAVRHVPGVKGIVNRIHVAPASTADVKRQIVRALHRDADLDARGIQVSMSGTTAALAGRVRTWHERESAERAAMHAPGVARVDNRIVVESRGVPEEVEEIC